MADTNRNSRHFIRCKSIISIEKLENENSDLKIIPIGLDLQNMAIYKTHFIGSLVMNN